MSIQHVTILALPVSLASSISLPLEILNAANEIARSRNRKQAKIDIEVVGVQAGPVKTAGGLEILATQCFSDIQETDLLILPSLWRNPLHTLTRYQHLLPWIKEIAGQHSLICAVGSSSYFLAEAGLLDRQPATTHWYYCDQFAERYPNIDVKPQHLITQADTIYCAGSVNSIADLMVHLIAQMYGQDIARLVEAQFSPEIRRPFEDHAYAQAENSPHHDEAIIAVQEWLRQHHHESFKLATVAEEMGLSMRNFNRRFKQAVGNTAKEYLQKLRLDSARELLRSSNLSINEVAAQSGYQDSSYFCSRFKKSTGQTPLAYRKAVRGKIFHVTTEN